MNFNAYIQSGVPTPGVGQVVLTAPQVNVPNGWVYSTTALTRRGTRQRAITCSRPVPCSSSCRSHWPLRPTLRHSSIDACITRLASTFHTIVSLPAGESLLAVPVGRDGDLPRGCPGAVRSHLLVAAPPVRVIHH